MSHLNESKHISGVFTVQLRPFADDRGRFMETFRKEWFPQRGWQIIQSNRSDSKAGVLRGLHYHHHQVDYWYVVGGRIRAGLVDLRPSSPTYKATEMVTMGGEEEIGLFIPIGVAHGFAALTDATLMYVVDNYYHDGSDENGVAWDDPDIGLDWGLADPIISDRDTGNPYMRDIPPGRLPQFTR
jgi:dTDP-4-dehydrorhamnose 3,5-epimerase